MSVESGGALWLSDCDLVRYRFSKVSSITTDCLRAGLHADIESAQRVVTMQHSVEQSATLYAALALAMYDIMDLDALVYWLTTKK